MPNFDEEFQREFEILIDRVCEQTAEIIAEEATEYYKERFDEKKWNDQPWQPLKHPKKSGSLLVQSSALLNSIRPTVVTKERVVISGENQDVGYAQVHNEGFDGKVQVQAFTREIKGKRQKVKAHSRHMRIPQRQFMGHTEELQERIVTRIGTYIETITKK